MTNCLSSLSPSMQSVMEQFNPGLRNLVNLGKNYEKSVAGEHIYDIHINSKQLRVWKIRCMQLEVWWVAGRVKDFRIFVHSIATFKLYILQSMLINSTVLENI